MTAVTPPIFIAARLNPVSALLVSMEARRTFEKVLPPTCFDKIEEYHATVIYEPVGMTEDIPFADPLCTFNSIECKGMGYSYSYMGGGIIALILASPFLRAINKVLYNKTESRSRFSAYIPHISIASNVENIPKMPKAVHIPVMFDCLYSTALNK